MSKSIGIYAGRFCPIHIGHMRIINSLINLYGPDNSLVFIGSCNAPISWRVLFTYADRRRWIKRLYPNLKVMGIPDVPGNDSVWLQLIDDAIDCAFPYDSQNRIFFGGSQEDIEFFYESGRQIRIIDRDAVPVSATNVRQLLLMEEDITKFVDPRIANEVQDVFRKRLKMLDELRGL